MRTCCRVSSSARYLRRERSEGEVISRQVVQDVILITVAPIVFGNGHFDKEGIRTNVDRKSEFVAEVIDISSSFALVSKCDPHPEEADVRNIIVRSERDRRHIFNRDVVST